MQKVLADVKQFKNKNSSLGLWDNLMVFSNDKNKHVLVHKTKGRDRILAEKQRTGNQTLCLALAHIYGRVNHLSPSCHTSVGRSGTHVLVLSPKLPKPLPLRRDPPPWTVEHPSWKDFLHPSPEWSSPHLNCQGYKPRDRERKSFFSSHLTRG